MIKTRQDKSAKEEKERKAWGRLWRRHNGERERQDKSLIAKRQRKVGRRSDRDTGEACYTSIPAEKLSSQQKPTRRIFCWKECGWGRYLSGGNLIQLAQLFSDISSSFHNLLSGKIIMPPPLANLTYPMISLQFELLSDITCRWQNPLKRMRLPGICFVAGLAINFARANFPTQLVSNIYGSENLNTVTPKILGHFPPVPFLDT